MGIRSVERGSEMERQVNVFLFGSLRGVAVGGASCLSLPCNEPISVGRLLRLIGLPEGSIQLVLANHRAVNLAHLVGPGDRLSVFPKEYAVFVDWKDFRS